MLKINICFKFFLLFSNIQHKNFDEIIVNQFPRDSISDILTVDN